MKLTFNFVKGTQVEGKIIEKAEGWNEYTSEQVKQIIDSLLNGYKLSFNCDKKELIIESSQVDSVTIHL